jgi:phosphoglycerol transferase MdoB-like AlkP superfamily enzyme
MFSDIAFYKAFDSHLNFQAMEYLVEGGRTARHLIVTEPRFYLFVGIWVAVSAFFLFVVARAIRRTKSLPHRRSWIGQVVLLAIFVSLTFLGVRGRTGLSTIKWGVAYFSHNHFVNQLGLNGVYTFARALTEEGRDPRLAYLTPPERFEFAPFGQALGNVRALLGDDNLQWLQPDSSLRRLVKQEPAPFAFQPNVVIVLMESWSGRYTGALGFPRDLTPGFDRLAEHGILFTNFYAAGTRTSYGLAATLCSYPALPGRSVMTRYNARHPFRSLSEILNERGYFNAFAYGGDLVFDNMQGFFTTKAFDGFYGDTYFGRDLEFAKWGIPDHVLFEKVTALTDSLPRPFQMVVLTLSNHEPFDLPDSSVQRYFDSADSSKMFNATLYADFALEGFVNGMAEKPIFDSTIFVFTADHAHWGPSRLSTDPLNFQAPLLIYAPSLMGDSARRISRIGGQVDILPTLMGILGGDYVGEGWGRDLLQVDQDDHGFAVFSVLNRVGYIEREFFLLAEIGHPEALLSRAEMADTIRDVSAEHPGTFGRLRRRLHDYLQTAEQLSTPGAISITK